MIIYNIHPDNPQKRFIDSAVRVLKMENGIAVYPTDTVYGIGSAISNSQALDKISRFIKKDKKKLFSFLCSDFSQVSRYTCLSNSNFKLMKRYLPGPYTFILPASNLVPKKICPKRKTVGIRIPDCKVIMDLIAALDEPIANTSISLPGNLRGDPYEVKKAVANDADILLDIGVLENPTGSTIIDLTSETPEITRFGKGSWNE
ncbi:MAG TPA: L-threonylcarbamoyladenylate synthase [Chitinispirillaceae bacterium]|jgi:tRNA threonylcarbamoyl adenosine modification protein (Sua5/YciO/YrdC/YwlC family)|nr:L-threonylcarbamoyladenylate synthase [Chitinispirillaceae bacterium]